MNIILSNLNGVKLTEFGEYLRKQSIHILEEFDLFLNDINKMTHLKHEKLSLGFSFGVLNALSTDLISNFQQTYPQIELTITEYPDFLCEKAVWDGDLDIAFSIGPVDESKFHSKVIKTQSIRILINEKNPLSKKDEISFEDLKDEKFAIVNENFKLYHNFVNKCKEVGFKPNLIFTTAEIFITHKLSRLNKGLAISVDFVVDDINYPNVCSLPFSDKSFIWDVILIYKKDSILSNAGKIFIDYILHY